MKSRGFYITVFNYFECSNFIGSANIPADGTKTLYILPDVFFFLSSAPFHPRMRMACETTINTAKSTPFYHHTTEHFKPTDLTKASTTGTKLYKSPPYSYSPVPPQSPIGFLTMKGTKVQTLGASAVAGAWRRHGWLIGQ